MKKEDRFELYKFRGFYAGLFAVGFAIILNFINSFEKPFMAQSCSYLFILVGFILIAWNYGYLNEYLKEAEKSRKKHLLEYFKEEFKEF